MECIVVTARVKKLQKPLDHGIVSLIINPCNPRDVVKPALVIYADEYPIGEALELAFIIDDTIEFTLPLFITVEALVFQAKVDANIAKLIKERLGIRRVIISRWGIVDLYKPIHIVEKTPLEEFLNKLKNKAPYAIDDPYRRGIQNYIIRVPNAPNILLNLKLRAKLIDQL